LIDVNVISDILRDKRDRKCNKIKLNKLIKEDVQQSQNMEDNENWSCPTCTFLNPLSKNSFEICFATKPTGGARKKPVPTNKESGDENADAVFLKMSCLYALARYFKEKVGFMDNKPVFDLVKERILKEVNDDSVLNRLLVLSNLPI
ncbi:hypothetical protein MHBO_005215, partial [Bonamia ostreae]